MFARLVCVVAVMGVVTCSGCENCGRAAACACVDCPQARLGEADSGSTVDLPQSYRTDVAPSLAASGAIRGGTLTVSDRTVLLVQTPSSRHPLQFVTGRPGRARVMVAGTSFFVDIVVHRWPFPSYTPTNVLNPYNPVSVKATVGQEFGILFYWSGSPPTSVVSNDDRRVHVLDAFTAPSIVGSWHYGLFRAVGGGQATVTVTVGGVPTGPLLYPITVMVS